MSLKFTNVICALLLILGVLCFTITDFEDSVDKFCFHGVCTNLILQEVGGAKNVLL